VSRFYLAAGRWMPKDPENWCVSVGTLREPMVAHFKNQRDMLSYLHGGQLNYEDMNQAHKEIVKMLDKVQPRSVIIPEWVGKWKLRYRKVLSLIGF
jgi:hypothetical protein